ncbi:putative glucan endo-1 3-beta-glucosidase GVI [Tripterygium wilfordii]|uniref:glucan endo-1,3-beta-D-glucosidase n=1 Tax=Tripterygium wilfordii TaxID=458696 RepID=A0A7J7D9Q3_TRIWF|nr:putative glucan endo-1 3-beta-glucosidase GVI [Tripterygium wilfordii]KAF5743095.1 putative glucan endo-1 3-beta-glucosidase GVI [Tripterygium wilfordii]
MAHFCLAIVIFISATLNQMTITEASIDIGVTYQLLGDKQPQPSDVINLYKKYGIGKIRLYEPDPPTLDALKGTQISVALGIPKNDIPNLASGQGATNHWFSSKVQPYLDNVLLSYIVVGNDLIPGEYSSYIPTIMDYLQSILNSSNLHGIKVTTAVPITTLVTSYPPSTGPFIKEAHGAFGRVLKFLSKQGSPLMINVYPYYAYATEPVNIRLDYAQFTAKEAIFQDKGLSYLNLFDAMVDAFYYAMERLGVSDVDVVVGETGWPSAGNGNFTTPKLAATYNQHFIKHILNFNGTPKRAGAYVEGFLHTMINENFQFNPGNQNFGLFNPNMQPVYPLFSN